MKLPAIHFYPGDWLRDAVSGCSLAAQGLWLRMMILMHDGERYGYLSLNGSPIPPESIARRCGCDSLTQYESLLIELETAHVPERTKDGIIFSRRMVRDEKKRKLGSYYGRKGGGNPTFIGLSKGNTKPISNGIPEDEIDNEIESEKKPRSLNASLPSDLDTLEFSAIWLRWIQHRKEIKKKLTPEMCKAALNRLAKLGAARAVEIIEYTLAKGWQGLADDEQVPRAKGITHPITSPEWIFQNDNPERLPLSEIKARMVRKEAA